MNENDLLIEIGCEDLPARYVRPLARALGLGIMNGLLRRGIDFEWVRRRGGPFGRPDMLRPQEFDGVLDLGDKLRLAGQAPPRNNPAGTARWFATPRRLAFWLQAVDERQADRELVRQGPRIEAAFKGGQPTPAALGFAKSCGVELSMLKKENGQLVFRKKRKGRRTIELLPEIFEEALKGMDELVPKRMRWGNGDETFVRPVRWVLALYGTRVVPLVRFGLKAGRKTYGHRFHAPAAIALKTSAEYEAKLLEAKVWADFAGRRESIRAGVEAEAAKLEGRARITDELLDEVTALVEWPVVISGRIEERFLELPPEVIVATVETNQRYFTVFDAAGKLLPRFITVSNVESKDVAQVIAGNERVVRPRLADALFFWEQDRERTLAEYVPALDRVTFQQELGSVGDKTRRVVSLAAHIAAELDVDPSEVVRAAELCKADLVTRLVYEFPELQGVMGGYYARASGEPEAVARAIAEHYRPTHSGGPIPSTLQGRILALADKLDTLAGIFKIGQKPTASKDPFALRRTALGVLRILIEGGLDLNLRALLEVTWPLQPVPERKDSTLDDVWGFMVERLRGYCLERGASSEQFEAVRTLGAARPLDFARRLEALRDFQRSEAAAALAIADKRARNILRQAGSGATLRLTDGTAAPSVATHLFELPAEQRLLSEIERVESALAPLRSEADYRGMFQQLAALKTPVDDFFQAVMVMAEDPAVRANRLALLARLDALCREVADLSCLPG